MLQAAKVNEANGRLPCEITCIEPYPSPWLRQAPAPLLQQKVQTVPLDLFLSLEPNDLLFIDSSQASKNRLGCRIPGARSLAAAPAWSRYTHSRHISSIRLFAQQNAVVFDWQETALIHAFLIGNLGVRIVFCLSQLHEERP
jgi:hypothetical protein